VPPAADVTDPDPLAGRLQHIVFATADLDPIVDFYGGTLGFVESDRVFRMEGLPETMIGGAAWIDYDGDGYLDL